MASALPARSPTDWVSWAIAMVSFSVMTLVRRAFWRGLESACGKFGGNALSQFPFGVYRGRDYQRHRLVTGCSSDEIDVREFQPPAGTSDCRLYRAALDRRQRASLRGRGN